jgi:hypothetical protein
MPSARAERLLQWKQDSVKSAVEYEDKERATRLLTAKLRTERLAREVTSRKRCQKKGPRKRTHIRQKIVTNTRRAFFAQRAL